MFEKFLTQLDVVADCQLVAARRYFETNQPAEAERAMNCHIFARDKAARLRGAFVSEA